jgi:hypothetical protein
MTIMLTPFILVKYYLNKNLFKISVMAEKGFEPSTSGL